MKLDKFRWVVLLSFIALLVSVDFVSAQCGGRGGRGGRLFGGGLFGGRVNRQYAAQGCAGGQQYAPQGQYQYYQQPYFAPYGGGCANGQCYYVPTLPAVEVARPATYVTSPPPRPALNRPEPAVLAQSHPFRK